MREVKPIFVGKVINARTPTDLIGSNSRRRCSYDDRGSAEWPSIVKKQLSATNNIHIYKNANVAALRKRFFSLKIGVAQRPKFDYIYDFKTILSILGKDFVMILPKVLQSKYTCFAFVLEI